MASIRRHIRQTWLTMALMACAGFAQAQAWPQHPVRLVVPSEAGGFTDILARVVAQQLTLAVGQSVYVDNRPGAGGLIAASVVTHAAPDGYTIMLASLPHLVDYVVNAPPSHNAVDDFSPITLVAETPNVWAVVPQFPAHDLRGLVATVKAAPGRYNFASNGPGSSSALGMQLFQDVVGLKMTEIPYKGSAAASPDLLSGRVWMTLDNLIYELPFIKSGQLRAIAVTGEKRSPLLPDVPTITESGFPNAEVSPWFGVVGPAHMPREIVDKIQRGIAAGLQSPEVQKRLMGAIIIGSTPEDFSAQMHSQLGAWSERIKRGASALK